MISTTTEIGANQRIEAIVNPLRVSTQPHA